MTKVDLPRDLVAAAQGAAIEAGSAVDEHLTRWVRIGRAAEDNPDLPAGFLAELLDAVKEESDTVPEPYRFG